MMAETADCFEQDAMERSCAPMLYFSHDSNAMDDIKCKLLVRRGGFEAYGRWWRLCELLAMGRGHTIHVEDEDEAAILADDLGFDSWEGGCRDYIGSLADIGLIDPSMLAEGRVCSKRMMDNALRFGRRRAGGARGGRSAKDSASNA